MNTATDSLETNTPMSGGGHTVGQSASDLIAFYAATPIAQPSGAAQAAIVDGSTGTAAATNGIAALTATYNSTLIINSIATLAAQSNAIRNALVSLGLIEGSA
jgi:nitrous oxidase accessory protein NosD